MTENENMFKSEIAAFANGLILIFLSGFILYWGKSIFIPVSYALLISFILYPISHWMEEKGLPRSLAIMTSLLILISLITLILVLLTSQLIQFSSELPALREKLMLTWSEFQSFVNRKTGYTIDMQNRWMNKTLFDSSENILPFLRNFLYGSIVNIILFILIPILAALLLYSREHWLSAIVSIFNRTPAEEIHRILRETIRAYYNFIKGMGIVYLTVGILNSIGLLILGISHPFLFGFMASILTFIPYVGIVVASLLPITISWMEYDSIWYPVGVIALFTFVQYLEANLIFPLAVSSKLNINPFMTIIAILTGGLFWGASGMILFVPFAAILKLISEHSKKWKTIGLILGSS
jgi:predicted PurR-regulated permease PerM